MAGRGYNTVHGFDTGPPPPGFRGAQPAGVSQYPRYYAAPAPATVPAYGWPATQPQYAAPAYAAAVPVPAYNYPQYSGYVYPAMAHPTAPGAVPDHGFPGIHLRNHTGGVGLPPGYDYAFPAENCRIHVFKTTTPPWQTTIMSCDTSKHVKLYVPTSVTVKDLMQQLGATNQDGSKNKMYEITEVGNGKWARGLSFTGGDGDKERVKKPITDYGWDKTRTGNQGERPVVWLWVTKD